MTKVFHCAMDDMAIAAQSVQHGSSAHGSFYAKYIIKPPWANTHFFCRFMTAIRSFWCVQDLKFRIIWGCTPVEDLFPGR